MADWRTVRYDPTYVEPLDPEIIPLCDALNAAGFVTTSSCCGHGYMWPHVWFEHSSDERIEQMARFVLATEVGDYRPHFSMWQKEVRLDGYAWDVEVHLNNAYRDTPIEQALAMAVEAINAVAAAVTAWYETERRPNTLPTPAEQAARFERDAEIARLNARLAKDAEIARLNARLATYAEIARLNARLATYAPTRGEKAVA